MKFAKILPFVILLGMLNAYQSLSPGSFLYNNVTLGSNSSILAGIDTSGPLQLIVIRTSDFNSWVNGGNVNTLFGSQESSGVYQINLTAGHYTVIFSASSNVQVDAEAFGFRNGSGRIVDIANNYTYNLVLQRYSTINISILTDKDFAAHPITVNVSGYSNVFSNGDNFDSLYNIDLDRGTYQIVFTSTTPTQAFLSVSIANSIINPLTGFNASFGYPVGVVSYGVYNDSGTLVPYQVSTDQVVGDANITALSAEDLNYTLDNNSQYGASLQLNVELNTQLGGVNKVFWLQNVVDLNTSQKSYYLVSNIWNNTVPDANLTNTTLVGSGNVTVCGSCGNQTFYADSYPSGIFNYSLPLNMKLVIEESQNSSGTVISFGYQVLQSGGAGEQPLVFYDRVLLPGYDNSTMLVTPYFYTPSANNLSGNYYDAELVFGGESGGAQSYFNELAAKMWIYYSRNGTLVPFPSAYTFGQDTAETAANVRVLASNYGDGGIATVGKLNPTEQIIVGRGINASVKNLQNSSRVTSAPTTTTQQSIATIPGLSSTGLSFSRVQLIEYAVSALILIAVLMVIKLLLRKR